MPLSLFVPRRQSAAAGSGAAAQGLEDPKAPGRPEAAAPRPAHSYAREAAALLLLAAALYAALAFASFRGDPMRPELAGDDWVGPIGSAFARSLVEWVGLAA